MATQGKAAAVINTVDAERLNAPFRTVLVPLARRTYRAVHHLATLEVAVWLVGCCYNSCTLYRSLRRVARAATDGGRR